MKKVLLLLANGFEFFEASVFIDVIGWNQLEGDGSTKLITAGLTKNIRSTFGQQIIVEYTTDQIRLEDFSALAIPGGFEEFGFYEDAFSEPFLNVIRSFHKLNIPIFSICTGALPIAKSGILKGLEGTTYNLNPNRLKMLEDLEVKVVHRPIVTSNNITTSWNPSTAMEVAFVMLESLTSIENTHHVKHLMGYP